MEVTPHEDDPPWAPGYRTATQGSAAVVFRFRARPEDFIVEEQPLDVEKPDPAGTHVWFTVNKRGISTPDAARRIARALGKPSSEVSFAGRKDAFAVTRQRMSVEHVKIETLLGLDLPGLHISDPFLCRRRLRIGQLAGNRFHLRLTGLDAESAALLGVRLREVAGIGVPNYYGSQRFGGDGLGFALGHALVSGDPFAYLQAIAESGPARTREADLELLRRARDGTTSERRRASELGRSLQEDLRSVAKTLARRRSENGEGLVESVPKRSRAFHLAILQARMFNRVLAARVANGTFTTVLEGDIPVDGVPSGPLWAFDMRRAEGVPGDIEQAALDAEGLSAEALERPGGLHPRGARRPLFVRLGEVEVGDPEPAGDGLGVWIAFDLPVGSYATVVLSELAGRPLRAVEAR